MVGGKVDQKEHFYRDVIIEAAPRLEEFLIKPGGLRPATLLNKTL